MKVMIEPRRTRASVRMLRFARVALVLGAVALSTRASAKDDTPNVEVLARAHPWHPLFPSTTDLEVRCGADVTKLELRTARGKTYLVAADWEALDVGTARYVREKGGAWRPCSLDEWLAPRVHGLGLRELTGAPILPSSWTGIRAGRDDRPKAKAHLVRVDVARPKTTLVFDELAGAWTELGDLRVEELAYVGRDRLPLRVAFGAGCSMTRTLREPVMPSASELPAP
ncbi:hypothetical protein L6R52_38050 [Myxococcota bacterium]|nr:hypothetical protein [Myxococcota bacterium]